MYIVHTHMYMYVCVPGLSGVCRTHVGNTGHPSKFSRIAPPRQGEKNFDDKAHTSLVAEFNRTQREMGKGTCGPTAASEWFKKHRPKVALHPSMTDYCDTYKEELCRTHIRGCLHQSGSAAKAELRSHRDHKVKLEEEIKVHKQDATTKSVDKCQKNWSDIMRLTSRPPMTPAERDELERLQHCFTLTISADYQQSKLILSWGKTEQPRSTYYFQKVSHDIFGIGIVDRDDEGIIYVFDERIGPKNTEHTLSFLSTYWQQVSQQHPWIQRLAILFSSTTRPAQLRMEEELSTVATLWTPLTHACHNVIHFFYTHTLYTHTQSCTTHPPTHTHTHTHTHTNTEWLIAVTELHPPDGRSVLVNEEVTFLS